MSLRAGVGLTLREAFEDKGIKVLTATTATSVARRQGDHSPSTVTTDEGDELGGDELLLAVGRVANSDDLGLDSIGLEPGGPLNVDDRLSVRGVDGGWLYAVGDVNGRVLLTDQGKYQAPIVGDVTAGKGIEAWADHAAVPRSCSPTRRSLRSGRSRSRPATPASKSRLSFLTPTA